MRHGEDNELQTPEWWDLTQTGIDQIRQRGKELLQFLLRQKPEITEVSIYHTPAKRGKQSAEVLAQEIQEGLHIKKIVPEDFLQNTDMPADKITQETVEAFLASRQPSVEETQIIISHSNVLWQLAFTMFNMFRASLRTQNKQLPFSFPGHDYHHGDLTDEYGNPVRTESGNHEKK